MTKNKKPQFRTAVTDFAKSVWIVSRGRFPDRTELYAAASRAEAEVWQKDNTHPKRDRTYVAAAHVIFMNGQWWKVLANPVKLSIPHPRTPPVSLPPPKPTSKLVTYRYSWAERLHILFRVQITRNVVEE